MTATLLMASLPVADITRSLLVVFRYKKQAHSQLHFVWGECSNFLGQEQFWASCLHYYAVRIS